jgi:hypothetical protein
MPMFSSQSAAPLRIEEKEDGVIGNTMYMHIKLDIFGVIVAMSKLE